MENLIVIKQLPIIEENLKTLSIEIKEKTETAKNLVCTIENVKEIKKVRAELNKDFNQIEEHRKAIKKTIYAPYESFNLVYEEFVATAYKDADFELKKKINEVESQLIAEKTETIKAYFDEYCTSKNIDIPFEKFDKKILISTSVKKINDDSKKFIDNIVSDYETINTLEEDIKSEVLVEYQQHYNLANAIKVVKDRKIAVEREKEEQLNRNKKQEETKKIVEHNEKFIPKIVEETTQQKYSATFSVCETKEVLKKLVDFMRENDIKFIQN